MFQRVFIASHWQIAHFQLSIWLLFFYFQRTVSVAQIASVLQTVPDQYVNEPDDDLKCAICLDVVQDPLQHQECEKLFCTRSAYREARKTSLQDTGVTVLMKTTKVRA